MAAQLWTDSCGIGFVHDPHGFIVTTGGGTVAWMILCKGKPNGKSE